mgnify:CR=1 FL=1
MPISGQPISGFSISSGADISNISPEVFGFSLVINKVISFILKLSY